MADKDKELPSVGGDYTLTEKLGEGAFGEVYKARHELLGQEFAVKVLRPELSEDQDVRDRFLDEARALIRFSHPNVVQVRHVGEDGGRLYLVMDLLHGRELGDIMKEEGALDEKRAVDLCKQMLAGLEAAHAAGIVHRDLKPSNMIVEKKPDGSEHIKILDFGLSKFSAIDGEQGAHRSITGTIVGTLAYMSPEQIKGDADIDGRSDLFAAALILQEMLQGHHPYPGESGIVVAAKLLRDPIPPIEGTPGESLTTVTKGALARALERDRDARFASVTAFAQALDGKGPPSDTSRVTTVQDAARELARQEAEAARKAKAEKKKSVLPLVAVLAVCGIGAAVFAILSGRKGDDPEPGPAARSADIGKPPPKTDPGPTPPPADPKPVDPVPPPADPKPVDPVPPPADPKPVDPVPPPADPKPVDPVPPPADPKPVDPVPPPADPKPVDPPKQPGSAQLSPKECCAKGWEKLQSGDWRGARALYKQAVEQSGIKSDEQVAAMRGVAESYLHEADDLARSGKVREALVLLAETRTWLAERYGKYEDVPQAMETVRLQLGFSRMHIAEAEVEMARWMAIDGNKAGAVKALQQAATDYDFALHQLDRDGVRYWEFLIRRAQMHWLKGDSKSMIADVAHTTKTNNEEVPAHMWVAHATAARRLAQAWGREGNTESAYGWAQKASKVAEDGASWTEDKLTRQQWLDLARVLFVQATLMPPGTDPTALHGKMRYWVSEAAKRKPEGWMPADMAKARLTTGQAAERYLQGLVFAKRGQKANRDKAFAEANKHLEAAIALGRRVAKDGGRLEDGLPYEVLAALTAAMGKDATAARSAAAKAQARNPD